MQDDDDNQATIQNNQSSGMEESLGTHNYTHTNLDFTFEYSENSNILKVKL